ncbi:hypothetical protein K8R43_03855 [archaeon]|nr:hypothetical protein [archaeon]
MNRIEGLSREEIDMIRSKIGAAIHTEISPNQVKKTLERIAPSKEEAVPPLLVKHELIKELFPKARADLLQKFPRDQDPLKKVINDMEYEDIIYKHQNSRIAIKVREQLLRLSGKNVISESRDKARLDKYKKKLYQKRKRPSVLFYRKK